MTQIRRVIGRANAFVAAGTLAFTAVLVAFPSGDAAAGALLDRSLMVTSTVASDDNAAPDGSTYTYGSAAGEVPAGDPRNGTKVGHRYAFTPSTGGTIHGFTIEYCSTAFGYVGAGACTNPSGFSANAWDGKTIQIEGETFTIDANANNFLTFTSDGINGISGSSAAAIDIDFTAVTNETDFFANPDTAYKNDTDANNDGTADDPTNGTYFAHINTFSSVANATAGYAAADIDTTSIDNGTVTNNVTESISIYTRVQETLNFSVEGEDGDTAGPSTIVAVGDPCTALTGAGDITLGDSNFALSTDTSYKATSYFRLATNSANGTEVFYSGDTLKSPSHTMAPMGNTDVASVAGTEQFGLGINDDVAAYTDISNLTLDADYDNAATDLFAFNPSSVTTPEPIASSNGIVDCETAQVDYVANIDVDTPAGIYTTKINYIASPSY